MPRQPRFDAPGVVHHVMVRGIERRAIFADDSDREDLVERLCELVPEAGASAFAWAFMGNHVHAVIRTGDVPLSRLMQRLNTGYAVRFNRRHERVGYLFQNRFRSRLVSSTEDLQGLIRYVHLNPVRGGLVGGLHELERYRWCGHGALVGRRPALPFENIAGALSIFAGRAGLARRRLIEWMRREELPAAPGFDAPPGRGTGADKLDAALEAAPDRRGEDGDAAATVPRDKGACVDGLIRSACAWFSVSERDLLRGARTLHVCDARALVCHVGVALWRLPTTQVASALGVSPAAVSQALPRGARIAAQQDVLQRLRGDGSWKT